MRSPEDNLERIFIRAPYTIHYRRLKRVKWSVEMYANYTALFMLGGQMKIRCGEVGGDLNEHSVLLLNPGEQASARGMESEFLTASLSSSYVVDCAVRARLIRSGAVVSFHKSIIEPGASMTRLSRDLRQELLHREAGQELVISAIVDQMVVQLLRHHSHVRRSDELELSRAGLVDRRIRRAVELMNAQLHRDLPLSEIAAAAYISPFHFARVFKKLTGATPHAYLASLRATRAQTLLAETDLSVTEVGARVGYASSSHFSKAFRGATGMTPRSFRSALVKRMDD